MIAGSIEIVISIASVLVAVAAIIVAILAKAQAAKIAAANLRPVLGIDEYHYTNLKSVKVSNYGGGTAVITSISFSKEGKTEKRDLVHLFDLKKDVMWDEYRQFPDGVFYLREGQQFTLVELSKSNLVQQGFSENDASSILDDLDGQFWGIQVSITYEDLLGNKKDVEKRDLRTVIVA